MTDELRWYLLTSKKIESEIANIFRLFRENRIEPILIKGWAAAQNYPPDRPRFYGDVDLAVAAEDYERASIVARTTPASSAPVDLHKELRHLDQIPWATLMRNSREVAIGTDWIRVLSDEDHLRVMATHWLNDGGASKDRLWDIYYAVANRPKDFDWHRCLDVVTPRRQKWVIAAIGLAHRYLGLRIDDLPFATEALEIPLWLTGAVEKEWATDIRLRPLYACLRDPKALLQQLKKRIPPNPIQATIETEGEFDERSRIPYQIRDVVLRLGPSIRRLSRGAAGR